MVVVVPYWTAYFILVVDSTGTSTQNQPSLLSIYLSTSICNTVLPLLSTSICNTVLRISAFLLVSACIFGESFVEFMARRHQNGRRQSVRVSIVRSATCMCVCVCACARACVRVCLRCHIRRSAQGIRAQAFIEGTNTSSLGLGGTPPRIN